MYSYDWIVLVTLGLDRWQRERQPSAHEIEFREAHQRHEEQIRAAAPEPVRKGLRARLFRRRQEATACS